MILWYLHRRRSTRNTANSSRSPRTPPFLTSSINPFTTQTSIITSSSKNGEHRGPRLPSPTHVAVMEEGDRYNVIANTDLGNVHAVNDLPETRQMDPSVITHGDGNMSVENNPIESATVIAVEDRVNADVEDSATAVLPTEVLLRILSQRMQRQQWDGGDNPPDYATAT
ncbi:hypothetical protein B0H13DRAFT_1995207 [Mycena leptocephala]|nr:hypothetical protein B0H13DRAFT_1995207 [Mycena leptocephala]